MTTKQAGGGFKLGDFLGRTLAFMLFCAAVGASMGVGMLTYRVITSYGCSASGER